MQKLTKKVYNQQNYHNEVQSNVMFEIVCDTQTTTVSAQVEKH